MHVIISAVFECPCPLPSFLCDLGPSPIVTPCIIDKMGFRLCCGHYQEIHTCKNIKTQYI